LVRLALHDGEVVLDREARLPGRGAWIHPREDCAAEARKRDAFARAFRRSVTTSSEKLEWVYE
jgi:predicted RNA-binding protein YlxR (DUF448 family)